MKTTIKVRDDLLRRAKAQAALRGWTLSRYLEESLEKSLKESEKRPTTTGEILDSLPNVPKEDVAELRKILDAPDFRQIDQEMWR